MLPQLKLSIPVPLNVCGIMYRTTSGSRLPAMPTLSKRRLRKARGEAPCDRRATRPIASMQTTSIQVSREVRYATEVSVSQPRTFSTTPHAASTSADPYTAGRSQRPAVGRTDMGKDA